MFRSQALLYNSIGPGIEYRIRDFYVLTGIQFRSRLSEKIDNHFCYSLGIAGTINRPKKALLTKQPAELAVGRDSDGDGILDTADRCPTVPGLLSFQGCPDSDGDGIEDRHDNCPGVFGLVRYSGCPVPDTDKDGINDELDSCITIPGTTRYKGCPVPDTDGDGINDEVDSCISVPGVTKYKGCPAPDSSLINRLDKAAHRIFFSSGSFQLLPQSFPALNEIIEILKQDSKIKLFVEGHTDNVGTVTTNLSLSENRAREVRRYLISKGIEPERLSSTGYGPIRPVASNKTASGRAKNRRVELKIQ